MVMNLTEYFARPDTPQAESTIGRLMVRLMEKNPGMVPDTARAEAHALLAHAAGRQRYSLPRVLSAEEQAVQADRLKQAFTKAA